MTRYDRPPRPKISFRCGMKGTVLEKIPGEIPGTSIFVFRPYGKRLLFGIIPVAKKEVRAENVLNSNIDFRPPNDYNNVADGGEFIIAETFDGSKSSDIYDVREEKLRKTISMYESIIDILKREIIKMRHIAQVSKDTDLLQREMTKLFNNVRKWRSDLISYYHPETSGNINDKYGVGLGLPPEQY